MESNLARSTWVTLKSLLRSVAIFFFDSVDSSPFSGVAVFPGWLFSIAAIVVAKFTGVFDNIDLRLAAMAKLSISAPVKFSEILASTEIMFSSPLS